MKKAFLGFVAASMLLACHSKTSSLSTDSNKVVQAASTPVTSTTEGTVTAPGTAKPTTKADTANAPVLAFEKSSYDFGKIKQGDKVSHDFKFSNNGKSPLIISDVVASCGCTKPDWPKIPIAPGSNGVIKVVFNSAGKSGLQDKLITITANTLPAQSLVHLIGEVKSLKIKK